MLIHHSYSQDTPTTSSSTTVNGVVINITTSADGMAVSGSSVTENDDVGVRFAARNLGDAWESANTTAGSTFWPSFGDITGISSGAGAITGLVLPDGTAYGGTCNFSVRDMGAPFQPDPTLRTNVLGTVSSISLETLITDETSGTLQDNAPKPLGSGASYSENSGGSANNDKNAFLFEFSVPIDDIGFFLGDVENTSTGVDFETGIVEVYDASNTLLHSFNLVTTTSPDDCASFTTSASSDPSAEGCGSAETIWVDIQDTDGTASISKVLVIVGDYRDDPTQIPSNGGSDNGGDEHLSFTGLTIGGTNVANTCPGLNGDRVFISEINYDDSDGAPDEFVEIAGPVGTDLSDYVLVNIDADGDENALTRFLTGTIPESEGDGDGMGALSFPYDYANTLKGLILVNTATNEIVEAISWEGTIDLSTNAFMRGTTTANDLTGELFGDFTTTNIGTDTGTSSLVRSNNATASTVESLDANGCPPATFFNQDANGGVLPVSLTFFNVEKRATTSILKWQTASEENNDYFRVEHSLNGVDFNTLAEVEGQGNSVEITDYNYVHETPSIGNNYYRLAQVDFSGEITYTGVKIISFGKNQSLSIQPTFVENNLNVVFENSLESNTSYSIIDVAGNVIKQGQINSNTKYHSINVQDLSRGVYFIIANEKGNRITNKFIKK